MKLNRRKLASAAVLAAILVGGGASVAAASGGSSTAPTAASQSGGQADDPGYVGSVRAPGDNRPDGPETAGSESQESAALQSLAKVTPAEAEKAALAAVPGTAAQPQLENENGNVVYSVEVTGANGTVTDVKVDAGNGSVLDKQAGGDNGATDGHDQPEGPTDAQD